MPHATHVLKEHHQPYNDKQHSKLCCMFNKHTHTRTPEG